MPRHDRMQLLVEAPDDSIRLIRVIGRLDVAGAAAVLRTVGAQLELVATHHRVASDLLLDLAGVSGYDMAGLKSLRHARFAAGRRGIAVHLCGFDAGQHPLPATARRVLTEFRRFPTAGLALDALLGARAAEVPAPARPPVQVAGAPGPVPPMVGAR